MKRSRVRSGVILGSAAALVMAAVGIGAAPAVAAGSRGEAPGAPGAASDWVTGDKDGFGTARGTSSKVWYTLNNGELSEIYYPRIDTPSTRDTQLVVTDGRTFTDRETTDTIHQVRLLDPQSLIYQQIDRAKSGKYLITKTYVTDPARSTVLVDIKFRSLTGQPYQVYLLHDPALTMTGDDDTGSTQGGHSWPRTGRPATLCSRRAGSPRPPAATKARATAGPIWPATTRWTGHTPLLSPATSCRSARQA